MKKLGIESQSNIENDKIDSQFLYRYQIAKRNES